MEGTSIFEGTVYVDADRGKVYLGSSQHGVVDLNGFLMKFVGEVIKITVTASEKGK